MKDAMTIRSFAEMKKTGRKIVTVTAYDATFAQLCEAAGVDIVLVGDSLGMVIQGHPNTLPVTLDQMVYHTRIVSRGLSRAFLVMDLPFHSLPVSMESATAAAVRALSEGNAQAVKVEGATPFVLQLVSHLTSHGIPVMGHVGLIPQSVHQMGGFRIQGKTPETGARVLDGARLLEEAGAFSIVLEAIPHALAREITDAVSIPTIGIGAGPHCDGQVLVSYDLLGLNETYCPRFVKKYAQLAEIAKQALVDYAAEVRTGIFPPADERGGKPPADERGGKPPADERGGKPPADERGGKPPADERGG
ncbi:3-methyl-2-oxobutanoate hydroxymethyltransferase, partial [Myxococcota bacterium]|nr:3-methyl-2-oxobutanoate hydroxymethyltransferase [Myxococcota bacterium]